MARPSSWKPYAFRAWYGDGVRTYGTTHARVIELRALSERIAWRDAVMQATKTRKDLSCIERIDTRG